MFAWILILGCFVALLSLIMHDATKDDGAGSAISIGANKIKAFTFWAMLKAQRLLSYLKPKARRLRRRTRTYWTSRRSTHPVEAVTPVNAISSSSEEVGQESSSLITQTALAPEEPTPELPLEQQALAPPPEQQTPPLQPEMETLTLAPKTQAPALRPKKKWWKKESRVSMTTPELESAISDAVKNAGCEDFVGVIIRPKTRKSQLDPNWAVQGVKFGKSDRTAADQALTTVVERMQREFLLSED
jgi:hypothetical protein